MLTIARTLMGNPKLVLLDEPSEGIAPVIVEQMAEAHPGDQARGA
jgi:branched-chain amino acid transport system ATP-binding protein